ncbi:MAG TPA: cation:proton antiporter [Candidatus Dormibacteraeota bacterium]|nr:cation:proton antiporter [Candidatus Dormibacteraeota bacterium]
MTPHYADPVAPILIALMLIGISAELGGWLVQKVGQPAVLGELLVGILIGNLAYWLREPIITVLREGDLVRQIANQAFSHGVSLVGAAQAMLPPGPATARLLAALGETSGPRAVSIYLFVDDLSRLAIIFLLFLVGLETSVAEMRRVGKRAFSVAVVGVACPLLLGLGAMELLMPAATIVHDLFIGGILTATSVGITARIFHDLGQTKSPEARIILGAAVIDDILGLLVLAVVTGLVVRGTVSVLGISVITLKAIAFLVGSIGAGLWLTPRLVPRIRRMGFRNVRLLVGLGLAFVLSWVATKIGLATIVGAFAAGLILERFFTQEMEDEHSLRDLLSPLESLVVPVFFVLMGLQVKLETFLNWPTIELAAVLTAVAIVGKVVSGVAAGRGVSWISVGIGMMPRGEVGLIFASIGRALGVVDDAVFSAVILMVLVTTLLTPPLLGIAMGRGHA